MKLSGGAGSWRTTRLVVLSGIGEQQSGGGLPDPFDGLKTARVVHELVARSGDTYGHRPGQKAQVSPPLARGTMEVDNQNRLEMEKVL